MNNKLEGKEIKLEFATKQEKQVLTLYFTTELVDSIDDFIHLAKKQLPAYKKRKLNRTNLIQLILDEVMQDHAKFQGESFVWKLLLTSKDNSI